MSDENRERLRQLLESLGENLDDWDVQDFVNQFHFWGEFWELRDLIAVIDREAARYDPEAPLYNENLQKVQP